MPSSNSIHRTILLVHDMESHLQRSVVSSRLPDQPAEHSALWALAAIATQLGIHADRAALAREIALGGRDADTADLLRAAATIGVDATVRVMHRDDRLDAISRPAILKLHEGTYVILGQRIDAYNEIFHADNAQPKLYSNEQLNRSWSGEVVYVTCQARAARPEPQDTHPSHWLLRSARRYQKTLAHILIASVFVQLFGLVTPIFFQVIVDKVLVHGALSTLSIAVGALVIVALFDVTLRYLRSYAIAHASTRVDLELNSRIFRHLLKLPLTYFESTPAGQIAARVREIEAIRHFFTGEGMMSIIDIIFAILFLLVLAAYSVKLTLVLIAFVPIFAAVVIVFHPRLLRRTRSSFTANADSQQFLIESLIGAQVIKAGAIEGATQTQWEQKRATYASESFHAQLLSNLGPNLFGYLNRLLTAAIIFVGARMVIANELTIGELVAFHMIVGQIVDPLMRLALIWQEAQRVKVSVERLGEITEVRPENDPRESIRTDPVRGEILLDQVTFRYSADAPDVLKNVSVCIQAGEVLGIVGASGSGKSTLAKLLQRFYVPQHGRVCVDGVDLAHVNPIWVRRQIGVVLQENLLFNRTIHDNIAITSPYITRDKVIEVAKLAGAHEFIAELPLGYDTVIEERGANLSGGQRQRVAIARALANDPRILILDEATSAVDYESERIIQANMKDMVRNRTVIIIAHRLGTVRHCDRILGLKDGRVVEMGTHSELLRLEGGLYRYLWHLQSDSSAIR